jgi:hypothetical protein
MGKEEVGQFLSALAVERQVSASTQNQALCALLFLYREVLGQEFGWLDNLVPAKQPQRLPSRTDQTRSESTTQRPQRGALAHGQSALRCRAPALGVLAPAG